MQINQWIPIYYYGIKDVLFEIYYWIIKDLLFIPNFLKILSSTCTTQLDVLPQSLPFYLLLLLNLIYKQIFISMVYLKGSNTVCIFPRVSMHCFIIALIRHKNSYISMSIYWLLFISIHWNKWLDLEPGKVFEQKYQIVQESLEIY